MSQNLFGNHISPACKYCLLSIKLLQDGRHALCKRNGVVAVESRCNRFQYDPLKRIPRKPLALQKFSKDDFLL
jgi:hypothetical protein